MFDNNWNASKPGAVVACAVVVVVAIVVAAVVVAAGVAADVSDVAPDTCTAPRLLPNHDLNTHTTNTGQTTRNTKFSIAGK